MKPMSIFLSLAITATLTGCGAAEGSDGAGSSEDSAIARAAISGPSYTFGIGSGLSTGDFRLVMEDSSEKYFYGGSFPNNSYIQGTNAQRFTRYPEALWSQSFANNTLWLRSGGLFDNEMAWQTWHIDTAATTVPGCWGAKLTTPWQVTMDYEVDSQQAFDELEILSTGDSCNSTVLRVWQSGHVSGSASFELPVNCPSAYVSVYYVKDASGAIGQDMARVKNVRFTPKGTVDICPPPPR